MKKIELMEKSKQSFGRSYRAPGAMAVVICMGLCFPPIASPAARGKLVEQNKAVARAAFEYLNHRDFQRFEELHTKDFVKHYNNNPAENLSEEMRDAKGQFDLSADLTITEKWMIAEGDKVAVCVVAKGTHTGVFHGLPPTGKRYEFPTLTVWRFVDGKIAEEWVFLNELDLYRQLGLFKEPWSAGQ
ncbi:MAG: ester cyclase [Acidobacteriia bacterium]|nr:ester cyclase [Terriglobia bacterium]